MPRGELAVDDCLRVYSVDSTQLAATVPFHRLSPFCLSAAWYATPEMRSCAEEIAPPSAVVMGPGVFPILNHLRSRIIELESDLLKSMKSPNSFPLCKYAFRPHVKDAKGNLGTTDWQVSLLLVFLYDRLLWATYASPTVDTRPPQSALSPYKEPSEVTDIYRKSNLEWRATIRKALDVWRKAKLDKHGEAGKSPGITGGVGASLWRGYTSSRSKSSANTMVGNFAAAALVLCALANVRNPLICEA